MNHFDPELDDEVRKARERFIDHREKQLQSLSIEANETAMKFLFTTNAGGAIALLAYLGTRPETTPNQSLLTSSIAFFFLGVLFIGIVRAFAVHLYIGVFKSFNTSAKTYFSEARDWDEFYAEIDSQVRQSKIPYIFGYAAFGCFLIGSLTGAMGLLI